MNWNKWIRQFHRGLSIAFTLAVIANVIVQGREKLALWVGMLTLLPLALLLLSGLYLFMLPYSTRWRSGRHANSRENTPTG